MRLENDVIYGTKGDFATLVKLSPAMITKLIKDGCPLTSKDNNLSEAVQWYINHLKDDKPNATNAKVEYIKAQTRLLEMKIAYQDGELIEVEKVTKLFDTAIVKVKSKLENMPVTLCQKLVGRSEREIDVIIKDYIVQIMAEFRDTKKL